MTNTAKIYAGNTKLDMDIAQSLMKIAGNFYLNVDYMGFTPAQHIFWKKDVAERITKEVLKLQKKDSKITKFLNEVMDICLFPQDCGMKNY